MVIWANIYNGEAYKYDFASHYPALLASSQHKYPIGAGTSKTFTKSEFKALKFYSFGIYHASVSNSDKRLFLENISHWYTHTDLNFAQKQGYKIKLIVDDEPNALLFDSKALMTGRELFGPFVQYLYKLKKRSFRNQKIFEYVMGMFDTK